jgi:hypothetical protein
LRDTHAERSKIMNSRTFSCAVIDAVEQYDGNTFEPRLEAPATWNAL